MCAITRKFLLSVFCLILTLGLAGCNTQGDEADSAENTEVVVPVQSALPKEGSLTQVTVVTGQLEAITSSNVVPSGAGGKVESVNVQVGSQVRQGQTLVMLEFSSKASLEAAIRQAEQGVEQAKQGVKQAEQGVKQVEQGVGQAEQSVEQAKAGLASAKLDYDQAKANYERGQELLDGGVISQGGQTGFEVSFDNPYQKTKIAYEQVAPATLASANTALASAKAAVASAEATVASAEAAVAGAEAAVISAKEAYNVQSNNAYIKSPISGVVTAVNVKPGEMASSAVPTLTIVNLSTVQVKTSVTEDQINKIEQGQQVPVLIKSASEEPFTGTITNIALAADASTKSYPIKVQIKNSEQLLKPGMFSEVQLTETLPQTLLVPSDAVVRKDSTDVVWVIKEGQATSREVTLGISDGKQTQILSGLKNGEQVVTVGQNMLDEKTKVKINNQETQP